MKELQEIFISKLDDLKAWLEINFAQKESVWLVYYKKSSKKVDFGWPEIVDVLLCYGWIDSLPGKYDDERTKLRISPRNPKSSWSRINKQKVEKLLSQNLIQTNGLKLIEEAKKNGAWNALDEVENLVLPQDLFLKLEKNNLLDSWQRLPRFNKRAILEKLQNSKRPETREKNINSLCRQLNLD